jgi:glycosyltransferase involved in cell wall biosynthesis
LFKRSNFQRLVVISEALRRDYIQMFPTLSEDRLVVAPDAADIAPTGADANPAQDWRRGNGRLQVGYVGHLYPGRGVEVLMQLARRLSEADVHIVGGTEQDIASWRSQAKGITNMHWHGYVPPARVDAFRQAMDVLVSPYQQSVVVAGGALETSRWMSPLKIFEYMAARKPIVASDLPVLREVLSHGVNALLVPPGSIEAWVSAIETLQRDPTLRDRLANQAFADVSARFTWMHRAQDVLAGVLN